MGCSSSTPKEDNIVPVSAKASVSENKASTPKEVSIAPVPIQVTAEAGGSESKGFNAKFN
jgi:hypothetical protein